MSRTPLRHDSLADAGEGGPSAEAESAARGLKVVDRSQVPNRPGSAAAPQTPTPATADDAPDTDTPSADAPKRSGGKRRYIIAAVVAALLVGAVIYGREWWTVGRFVETTEDAYVQSDIVSISVQVAGEVSDIPVRDNSRISAGDIILTLDPTAYEAAMAAAQADVDVAQAAIENTVELEKLQVIKVAAATADVTSAQSQTDLAGSIDERARTLLTRGASTQANVDAASAALDAATSVLTSARSDLAVAEGQFPILASMRHSQEAALRRAEAARDVAQLDLRHSVIRAPRDGIVANIGVRPGEYLAPGIRVMSLVPTQDSYITANFKETQIRSFAEGMPVEIEVDMLGGRILEGRIASIAPASGSEFSILPPDNATGNFTKVVQRVPVRIRLDDVGDMPLLRSGTSVIVSVDTKDGGRDGEVAQR